MEGKRGAAGRPSGAQRDAIAQILPALLHAGSLSEAGVRERTGFSRARVKANTLALVEEGWVAIRGGKRRRFSLGPRAGRILAISVAREGMHCAAFTPDWQMEASQEAQLPVLPRLPRDDDREQAHPGLGPQEFHEALVALARRCRASLNPSADLAACVVSWPMRISRTTGEPAPFRARPGWEDVPTRELISDALALAGFPPLKVTLINDANAEALAESRDGAGRDYQTVLVIKLAGGIGAGTVQRGQLITGAHGFAGEVGHIPVSWYDIDSSRMAPLAGAVWVKELPEEPRGMTDFPCSCGKPGHLQAFTSLPGIIDRVDFERLGLRASDAAPNLYFQRGRALRRGGTHLGNLLEETGRILGRALYSSVALVDPDAIIIRPSLFESGRLIDGVASVLSEQFADPDLRNNLSVQHGLGGRDGQWMSSKGAAILGFDTHVAPVIGERITHRAPA